MILERTVLSGILSRGRLAPWGTTPADAGDQSDFKGREFQGGTWEDVTFTGEEVAVVIDIVNNATLEHLDVDAMMNKLAAKNIIAARPIADMDQLVRVPYVGLVAMNDIKNYLPVWVGRVIG